MFSFTQPVYVFLLVHLIHFKVIIDMYDPITIFLIVLGLFSVSLFLLLCFLPREVPLAFIVKAGLVVLNSLSFCLSGKIFISPSYVNESLAG